MMNNSSSTPTWQTYSVSAAAARLGIAPATLRTWARRHDVGPSEHYSGNHRRYTQSDLARLMVMRTKILQGATVAEAAQLATIQMEQDVSLEQAERELGKALQLKGALVVPENEVDPHAIEKAVQSPERLTQFGGEAAEEFPMPISPAGLQLIRLDESDDSTEPDLAQQSGRDDHFVEASIAVKHQVKKPFPQDLLVTRLNDDSGQYRTRCNSLVNAALHSDVEAVNHLLALGESECPLDWWKLLVRPALDRISVHTVLAKPGKVPKLLVAYAAHEVLSDFADQVTGGVDGLAGTHPSKLKNITLVFSPEQDEFALPAHALTASLIAQECNAHVILGPGNSRRTTELVKMVRPAAVVFVSDQTAPNLGVLEHLSQTFTHLPIYVGVKENVELDNFRRLPNVNAFHSFRALFHEVYGAVCAANPATQYWDEGPSNPGLRSV